jgi:hypothetical protein
LRERERYLTLFNISGESFGGKGVSGLRKWILRVVLGIVFEKWCFVGFGVKWRNCEV